MSTLIPGSTPNSTNPNPLDQMQTQEGATAALNTALAATPEPHRSVISATLMLMLRQQQCLLEALEKQPAFEQDLDHMAWVPDPATKGPLSIQELYIKREEVMKLIRDFRGE